MAKIGSTSISTVKLGSTPVSRLYLGSTQVWSAGSVPNDPTALLLHFDGSVADSSPNANNMTAGGNLQISTVQSRFGGASGYFDNSSYVYTSSNVLPDGNEDFTVEMWVYLEGVCPNGCLLITAGQTRQQGAFQIALYNSTTFWAGPLDVGWEIETTHTMALHKWYHVAVCRQGGTMRAFQNGIQIGQATSNFSYTNTSGAGIGGSVWSGGSLLGYIDELRITKGVGLYTSNFVLPDLPFGAQVELLLHMDGSNGSQAFADSSQNALTVSANGNSQISTTQSRFGGASAYFDGDGDYLSLTGTNNSFVFGTGDFTAEWWFYSPAGANSGTVAMFGTGYPQDFNIFIGAINSTTIYWLFGDGSTWNWGRTVEGAFTPDNWHHIAVTRSNGTARLFVDGILIDSLADSTNLINSSNSVVVGGRPINGSYFTGYIDELRVIKGYAAYTTNFTPPEMPLDARVALLLHMDGSNGSTTFTDSSDNARTVTANDNAQISTAESRFGGASAHFDGSGDYLTVTNNGSLTITNQDFTVEAWVYFESTGNSPFEPICSWWDYSGYSFGFVAGNNYGNSTYGLWVWQTTVPHAYVSWTPNLNRWYHIAVSRTGETLRFFVDGVQIGADQYSPAFVDIGTAPLAIGSNDGHSYLFNGYIDELRIIKGYAAYTSNFVPPDLPFGAQVSLLLHMDGSNGSTSFIDSSPNALTVTANGNAAISTAESRFGGSSMSLAIGDYISLPNVTALNLDGDFTVEMWVRFSDLNSSSYPYVISGSVCGGLEIQINNADQPNPIIGVYHACSSAVVAVEHTLVENQWYHLAVTRQNGVVYFFQNGTLLGSANDTVPFPFNGYLGDIYSYPRGSMVGYIDELRIVKGYAAYTSNFTPPDLPFGASVSLLMHMDGSNGSTTFVDSSPNALTITANGNAAISTMESRFGSAGAFNGNGDRLDIATTSLFDLSGGDYTIECFFNITDWSGADFARLWCLENNSETWGIIVPNDGTGSIGIDSFGQWFTIVAPNGTIAQNTWYHLALVRQTGTVTLYIDGVNVGSAIESTCVPPGPSQLSIGGSTIHYPYTNFKGYIDEFRIVKGYAAYTSNFTPPELPFGAEVSLLLHMDGTNGSTSFVDSSDNALAVTAAGAAAMSAADFKFGGASMLGGYVKINDITTLQPGSADFTIECWFNIPTMNSGANAGHSLFGARANDGESGLLCHVSHAGTMYIFLPNAAGNFQVFAHNPGFTVTESAWHHFALVKSGMQLNLYLDGVAGTPATLSDATVLLKAPFNIGSWSDEDVHSPMYGVTKIDGYIDDFRIIKGYAAYTSNFTPPDLPFGAQVSLLLHMDGTNGSTSFVDSSANALTVTANGNAVISTTESRFGGASGYFDRSSGTYLTLPGTETDPRFQFGSGDFTIEAWVWFPYGMSDDAYAIYGKLCPCPATEADTNISFGIQPLNNELRMFATACGPDIPSGGFWHNPLLPSGATDSWHHAAWVRSGDNFTLYWDGVALGTQVATGTLYSGYNYPVTVGGWGTGGQRFSGYIDELRIIKGYAAYTSNFTPPELPFGAQVELLLHMDGTNGSTSFVDSSANALSLTANGNAQISTAQSKFGAASGYFDGNGDYLTLSAGPASQFGTYDFTIEAWVNLADTTLVQQVAGTANQYYENKWAFYVGGTDWQIMFVANTGSGWGGIVANVALSANHWHHVAVCRKNGAISLFVDGNIAPIGLDQTTGIGNAMNPTGDLQIGFDSVTGTGAFNGYIDELRIVNGYAAYTSNFTPPDLPFGAQVELLLHMDGSNGSQAFTDSSPYARALTVSNNAQISTEQIRFGESGYFNGNSGISCAALPAFGTDDFTLEAWVYINGLPNYFNQIVGQHVSGSFGDWLLGVFGTGQIFFQTQNKSLFSSQYLSADSQWHHIALVRKSGNGFLFLDGVLCDTADLTDDILARTNCVVGNDTTGGCGWNGYIDELRIIKGYAAYTSNFTPPSGPYNTAIVPVDYLVVAGGGSGGVRGGGGGAGGYREGTAHPLYVNTPVTVSIGAGGASVGPYYYDYGNNGNASVFDVITSAGGGGGGGLDGAGQLGVGGPGMTGQNGGSGGGGGVGWYASGSAGLGNTPSVSPSQGNDGGTGVNVGNAAVESPGGGGGAGAAGQSGSDQYSNGGDGGGGLQPSIFTNITGYTGFFAAGGGGGANPSCTPGSGGNLLGGAGAATGAGAAGDGPANTGSGGGGCGYSYGDSSGNGGSGIVAIRVDSTHALSVDMGLSYSSYVDGNQTVYVFTAGTGTITFTS